MEIEKYINEGHASFYDDVLRYKNPYSDDQADLWYNGWDSAQSEHQLFTENQSLQDANRDLKDTIFKLNKRDSKWCDSLRDLLDNANLCNVFSFRKKIRAELDKLIKEGVK